MTWIQILLPVIVALFIGFFVWIVRKIFAVETKVELHDTEIVDLKQSQKEEIQEIKLKIDKMTDKLAELCISFSKWSGYMERCKEEEKK